MRLFAHYCNAAAASFAMPVLIVKNAFRASWITVDPSKNEGLKDLLHQTLNCIKSSID